MISGRILIVEDEPVLVRALTDALVARGCEVMIAVDGQAGLELALEKKPQLILLDIMLPRVNGFEVCRAVRERGHDMPILMLTAKGQEEDVILGLNLGADDYITKPFRIGELVARVNAFLRRSTARHETICRFGCFELNRSAHKLFRDGLEIELTSKEFRLLEFFATRPGRALTRDDILNHVWGHSVVVTPRSIDRCVATLRSKIETDSSQPAYVHTIRDVGYRFEPGD
jgi:two-component system, OmpR family, alkaline phosphatase synthesis response regulator PhoP